MAKFDWVQYLIIARELATRPDNESALRSSISRAYYAAYNAAMAYCGDKKISVLKNRGAHEDLWDAFRRQGDLMLNIVSEKGDRMRRKRTEADYFSEVTGLESSVEQCLQESHDILKSLGFASPPP
jgi:uncharacterized protein (UPF0332 family)